MWYLALGTRVWHHFGNARYGRRSWSVGLSAVQRRLDKERAFIAAVFGAGSCLLLPSRHPTPTGTFQSFS